MSKPAIYALAVFCAIQALFLVAYFVSGNHSAPCAVMLCYVALMMGTLIAVLVYAANQIKEVE